MNLKALKTTSTVLTIIALIVCWALAGWVLNLVDFDAPEIMIFLGRLHPLLLHSPIGFMILALLLDIGHLLPIRKQLPDTTWLHGLTVLASTFAVIHGILLFASDGFIGSELAERHLIGGCAFLSIISSVFLIKLWFGHLPKIRFLGAPMVIIATIALAISAHDGASLTHGENYLSTYAPEALKPILEPGYVPKEESPALPSIEDQNVYKVAIQPIFDRVCTECHKASKIKGGLRMDSFAELIKGGDSGDAFDPGDTKRSLILERIFFPLDDEEHMPPEGKKQTTEDEISVISWWIEVGAPGEGTLKSFEPPAEILEIIEGF